jgi:hypothetical protein
MKPTRRHEVALRSAMSARRGHQQKTAGMMRKASRVSGSTGIPRQDLDEDRLEREAGRGD